MDDPGRSSKRDDAHFRPTPKKHQPGEADITGGITREGDGMVRSMLHEAAQAMLTRTEPDETGSMLVIRPQTCSTLFRQTLGVHWTA